VDPWTQQDREEFGRRLQLARLALDMTQASVMKQLEMGEDKKGTLSAWEVGRTMPTAETVARLADLYQISADFLLFGEIGPSQDAIAFAEAYEALTAQEQDAFRALWYGWVNGKIRPPPELRALTRGVETPADLSTLPEPVGA
jgi:transcriptional regulator with XRE-family HTH domain